MTVISYPNAQPLIYQTTDRHGYCYNASDGLRYCRLRGIKNVTKQAIMTAAVDKNLFNIRFSLSLLTPLQGRNIINA
ncbi:hypothetical protein FHS14_003078 [Paenibacillus baekrokdamisoli]|uniref:hypothetical protein n=1 Tax=Paenibacillus baekrokdamisoli TaxID=1712516 RepID=UPI000F79DB17|nr:hypothetical protein [Paenibacillus baekrokdamisoli]MBB3070083.1 hypothetical protein [Paenibacillus baekrokdamisoli]